MPASETEFYEFIFPTIMLSGLYFALKFFMNIVDQSLSAEILAANSQDPRHYEYGLIINCKNLKANINSKINPLYSTCMIFV